MSASVLYMSMSLDGFITRPDDNLDQPLGRDGERLHRWLASGGESVGEFRPSDPSAEVFDELMDTGAVVVGRRTFDLARRWNGDHHGVPIFVPTHEAPDDHAVHGPWVSYVTDGIVSTTTTDIPGYVVRRWTIDPVHSELSFTVRHLMVSKVRGRFGRFSGEIVTAPDPADSTATATVDLASIDTNNEQRDNHVRSADFFSVETYPTMTYGSTGLHRDGGELVLDGEVTLKGVTRSVPLKIEVNGFGPDASGGVVSGFSATGELDRRDFGVNFTAGMEDGGVVVGDKITLALEIEAVLQPASPK